MTQQANTTILTEETAIEMIEQATKFLHSMYHEQDIVEIVTATYGEMDAADEDDDCPEECHTCHGTGEGQADGLSCYACHGRGH